MAGTLRQFIWVYETEAESRARLQRHGFADDVATEIAIYLAQSTDLPEFAAGLQADFAAAGIELCFCPVDELTGRWASWQGRPDCMVWAMTDGVRYYRGSALSAWARLTGTPAFGASSQVQHLAQQKFASLTQAAAAGVLVPPTQLWDETGLLASLGAMQTGECFVKPETLGAKLGIWADSRCLPADVPARVRRIAQRYADRAVVQPFIAGRDVRVSFLNAGSAPKPGIAMMLPDARSETGGAFLTMKDNYTLSGTRDDSGAAGGFGAGRDLAFVPRMQDIAETATGRAIAEAVARLQRLWQLQDVFSMDFRVDADGRPWFLEFEICPAVTIYDFQYYLKQQAGMTLGSALVQAVQRAHARFGTRADA